jgi:glycine/D-amino acid oxidase-like deaminating enzyme
MISFWEKNSFLDYDCIIVGSGILGLSTACEIKEQYPDKEILVLERGIFPTGASTKNAGFLCFGSLTEILADIETKGEANAVELVEKRWQGINLLKQRVVENKMDYLNYGGYELIDENSLGSIEKIEYVNSLLSGIFGGKVFELKNEKIKEFGFDPGFVKSLVYSPYESQLDTGKMMKTLLKYTEFLGVQIHNGCEAVRIEDAHVIVKHNVLGEEVEFTSQNVIVCTNAMLNELVPAPKVTPGRGEVIITKPIENLKFKGIFHYDEGYYYFRNFNNRVILGGGRNLDFSAEETGEFGFNDMIISDLMKKLSEIILPGTKFEIEDKWTGIMGFTEDKLPMIQKISENLTAAVCCNGMGIALSSYVAREIVGTVFD